MEEWVDIPGYEGLYQITRDGKIRNVTNGNKLLGNVNSHGYVVVSLTKNGRKKDCKVHRLLALTFLPNPNDYDCINHKNGNKLDNRLQNLEWCTKGYNNRHAREVLGVNTEERPVCQLTLSGDFVALWVNEAQAARCLGISPVCIASCCEGRANTAAGFRWHYAGPDYKQFCEDMKRRATLKKIERLERQISELRQQL